MSQALYRKYRSRRLDEVLGQEHVTSILRAALAQGKIAHAYLLTGPRGVGKTSVARILAHEINALPYDEGMTHLDIIEIDAASNNGVDDIRMLREKAQVAPVSAAKKIYIIDEVHMLSKPAFNALLKTLEEPPAHVVFILATTDADKLPATILSRVQQFYFHPISVEVMAGQLMNIAASEGFGVDEAAARMIAEQSRGGFRDAISLLDQLSPLAAETPLTTEVVAAHLGLSGEATLQQLVAAWQAHDGARALELLRGLEADGADPVILAGQLMQLARRQLVDEPALVELIGQLIDVTRHPHPDLKLLTIFVGNYDTSTPPSSSRVHSSFASPQEMTHERSAGTSAIRERSTASVRGGGADAPLANKFPEQSAARVSSETRSEAVREISVSEKAQEMPTQSKQTNGAATDEPKTKETPKTKKSAKANPTLDWPSLLDRVKTDSPGRHSMLAKSGWQLDGHRLTIFAGQKLAATKLDDAKFRPQLAQIVKELTGQELDIVITPDKKPPADAKLAEIAAMMGGGEEVNLEELTRE